MFFGLINDKLFKLRQQRYFLFRVNNVMHFLFKINNLNIEH